MQKQILAALVALTAVPALAADTYKIEGSHTQSAFAVKHLMISTVRGEGYRFNSAPSVLVRSGSLAKRRTALAA